MNDKIDIFRQQALDAGYSPQEIDSFIFQQIGNQSLEQNQTSDESFVRKLGTGVVNLGKSLVDPFIETGKNIGTAAITIPQAAISSALSGSNPELAAKIASADILGSQERASDISEDPDKAARKQLADSLEIAAWAIPFGKGKNILTRSVLPGAGVGALTAPSTSEAIADVLSGGGIQEGAVEDIAGSALIGSAIPVGLEAGGSLLSKLGGKGTKLSEGVIDKTPNSLKEAFNLKGKNLIKKLDDMGIPTGSAQKKLDWAINKYGELLNKYNKAIGKVSKTFDNTEAIVKSLDDASLVADVTTGNGNRVANTWANRFENARTAEELSKLKFDLQDVINYGGKETNESLIAGAFHKNVDKILKDIPKVGGYLEDMSILHLAAGGRTPSRGGGLIRSANKSNLNILPASNIKIPGSRRTLQALEDTAGKTLRSTSSIADNISGAIPEGLVPQSLIRKATDVPSVQESDAGITNDVEYQIAQQAVDPQIQQNQQTSITGYSKVQLAQAYAKAVAAGDSKAASKLKTLYELESSIGDVGGDQKMQTALATLQELKGLYNSVQAQGLTARSSGLVPRAIGEIKGKSAAITEKSPEAATYNAQREAFLSLIIRGLGEVGTLNSEDIRRIEKALPKFSTSPETATLNWQTIENVLRNPSGIEATNQEFLQ